MSVEPVQRIVRDIAAGLGALSHESPLVAE